MSKPVVISIPHRFGKDEALSRIKSGFDRARSQFKQLLTVEEEVWSGDHLQFRIRALGQSAKGTIDVGQDHVRLEVTLPWLLAALADKIVPAVRKEGTRMLEQK